MTPSKELPPPREQRGKLEDRRREDCSEGRRDSSRDSRRKVYKDNTKYRNKESSNTDSEDSNRRWELSSRRREESSRRRKESKKVEGYGSINKRREPNKSLVGSKTDIRKRESINESRSQRYEYYSQDEKKN